MANLGLASSPPQLTPMTLLPLSQVQKPAMTEVQMTPDSTVLAASIISSFLLPYMKIGAEKLSEGVGKKLGEKSAEYACGLVRDLWDRVKAIFDSDDEKAVLAQFESHPDAAAAAVESMLKKKFDQDNILARDLSDLINARAPDGKRTGAQIIQAGIAGIVDARGAIITGATNLEIGGVIIKK